MVETTRSGLGGEALAAVRRAERAKTRQTAAVADNRSGVTGTTIGGSPQAARAAASDPTPISNTSELATSTTGATSELYSDS